MASFRKKEASGNWEARVSMRGHKPQSKSFPTKREAQEWAAGVEQAMRKGEPVARDGLRAKVADVLQAYLEDPLQKHGPGKKYSLAALQEDFGALTIETLTHEKLAEWLAAMELAQVQPSPTRKKAHPLYNGDKARTYSSSSRRKYYFYVKTALQWHAKRHKYSLADRFVGQSIPSAWEAPRTRRLEPGEEEAILAACGRMYKSPDSWRGIVGMALATAARLGELANMRWRNVNEVKRSFYIPKEDDKNKVGRHVPLSTAALAVLAKMRELAAGKPDPDDRVFKLLPLASSSLGLGFRRITTAAGCPGLNFHDLRHEATSRFFERTPLDGVAIAKITGHTDPRTLSRYANLRQEFLADALDQAEATALAAKIKTAP